jgi:cilia- and flagella-associated protein 251
MDGTVFMWRMDFNSLDALAEMGGEGVVPFSGVLDRGGAEEGGFWTELHDYFYFAQLKSQGEDTMRSRHISPTVPLSQVPHILCGLGYYPTEREVEDLLNELKFINFVDTGEQVEEVTLDTIIKAYVNHKPVFGVSEGHLEEAFRVLGVDANGALSMDYLLLQLQYKGTDLFIFYFVPLDLFFSFICFISFCFILFHFLFHYFWLIFFCLIIFV